MVKKVLLIFFLFLFFVLVQLLAAQRQSTVEVSTSASNSSNAPSYSFTFQVNSKIQVTHCSYDPNTKQIYYFKDAVLQKQTSFTGLYKIGASTAAGRRTYVACSLLEGDECGGSDNSGYARLIFNTLSSYSENINFNNLNSQVVANIASDPQSSLTLVQSGTISRVVLVRDFKNFGNYIPSTNRINLAHVTWNDNTNSLINLVVSNPISVDSGNKKIYATHTVFSYTGNNNQITYNFQRKVVDRSLTFGINAQLVEIRSSDGSLVQQVNGNYVLLPGKSYFVKYKVRLSDTSHNFFDNKVSADFILSSNANGISVSGSPINDLYLTKTDKEITYQISTNNDFSPGAISLVVSDIKYTGDYLIFNDSNSQVSVQSNTVNVACGVDRIIPNSQTANNTALVSTNVVRGSQYVEFYLNKVTGAETKVVGKGVNEVKLDTDGNYNLEYVLSLKSNNNQFCNPSNKEVIINAKLVVYNIKQSNGGYVTYNEEIKTVRINQLSDATLTFTNFGIRANANATVKLEILSITNNDCDTPVIGQPVDVTLMNNRAMSQYVEFYLSSVSNSTHKINVGKGVSTVNLQSNGKYQLVYNISLKTNNFFCNKQNEPITGRARLVVSNIQARQGGFINVPVESKDFILYPNGNEYQLVFNDIEVRANVEADISLDITNLAGNICSTPVSGAPNTIKLNLVKPLSQRLEYSLTNIKGEGEEINVQKGVTSISLTREGLKNITYSVSFLTENNFCNNENEQVTAVLKLVNQSTESSQGGYLNIPENERQKTVTLRPNQVVSVSFNNLLFMPNVKTELSLELVSITGNQCDTNLVGNSKTVNLTLNVPMGQELEYFLKDLKNSTDTVSLGQHVSEYNLSADGFYNVTYNITLKPNPRYCTNSDVKTKIRLNLTVLELQGSNAKVHIANPISNEILFNRDNTTVLITFYNLYIYHNVTVRLRLEKIDFSSVCDTPLKGLPLDEFTLRRYHQNPVNPPPPPPQGGSFATLTNCLVIWGYA